jgi:hypothetical protein
VFDGAAGEEPNTPAVISIVVIEIFHLDILGCYREEITTVIDG